MNRSLFSVGGDFIKTKLSLEALVCSSERLIRKIDEGRVARYQYKIDIR